MDSVSRVLSQVQLATSGGVSGLAKGTWSVLTGAHFLLKGTVRGAVYATKAVAATAFEVGKQCYYKAEGVEALPAGHSEFQRVGNERTLIGRVSEWQIERVGPIAEYLHWKVSEIEQAAQEQLRAKLPGHSVAAERAAHGLAWAAPTGFSALGGGLAVTALVSGAAATVGVASLAATSVATAVVSGGTGVVAWAAGASPSQAVAAGLGAAAVFNPITAIGVLATGVGSTLAGAGSVAALGVAEAANFAIKSEKIAIDAIATIQHCIEGTSPQELLEKTFGEATDFFQVLSQAQHAVGQQTFRTNEEEYQAWVRAFGDKWHPFLPKDSNDPKALKEAVSKYIEKLYGDVKNILFPHGIPLGNTSQNQGVLITMMTGMLPGISAVVFGEALQGAATLGADVAFKTKVMPKVMENLGPSLDVLGDSRRLQRAVVGQAEKIGETLERNFGIQLLPDPSDKDVLLIDSADSVRACSQKSRHAGIYVGMKLNDARALFEKAYPNNSIKVRPISHRDLVVGEFMVDTVRGREVIIECPKEDFARRDLLSYEFLMGTGSEGDKIAECSADAAAMGIRVGMSKSEVIAVYKTAADAAAAAGGAALRSPVFYKSIEKGMLKADAEALYANLKTPDAPDSIFHHRNLFHHQFRVKSSWFGGEVIAECPKSDFARRALMPHEFRLGDKGEIIECSEKAIAMGIKLGMSRKEVEKIYAKQTLSSLLPLAFFKSIRVGMSKVEAEKIYNDLKAAGEPDSCFLKKGDPTGSDPLLFEGNLSDEDKIARLIAAPFTQVLERVDQIVKKFLSEKSRPIRIGGYLLFRGILLSTWPTRVVGKFVIKHIFGIKGIEDFSKAFANNIITLLNTPAHKVLIPRMLDAFLGVLLSKVQPAGYVGHLFKPVQAAVGALEEVSKSGVDRLTKALGTQAPQGATAPPTPIVLPPQEVPEAFAGNLVMAILKAVVPQLFPSFENVGKSRLVRFSVWFVRTSIVLQLKFWNTWLGKKIINIGFSVVKQVIASVVSQGVEDPALPAGKRYLPYRAAKKVSNLLAGLVGLSGKDLKEGGGKVEKVNLYVDLGHDVLTRTVRAFSIGLNRGFGATLHQVVCESLDVAKTDKFVAELAGQNKPLLDKEFDTKRFEEKGGRNFAAFFHEGLLLIGKVALSKAGPKAPNQDASESAADQETERVEGVQKSIQQLTSSVQDLQAAAQKDVVAYPKHRKNLQATANNFLVLANEAARLLTVEIGRAEGAIGGHLLDPIFFAEDEAAYSQDMFIAVEDLRTAWENAKGDPIDVICRGALETAAVRVSRLINDEDFRLNTRYVKQLEENRVRNKSILEPLRAQKEIRQKMEKSVREFCLAATHPSAEELIKCAGAVDAALSPIVGVAIKQRGRWTARSEERERQDAALRTELEAMKALQGKFQNQLTGFMNVIKEGDVAAVKGSFTELNKTVPEMQRALGGVVQKGNKKIAEFKCIGNPTLRESYIGKLEERVEVVDKAIEALKIKVNREKSKLSASGEFFPRLAAMRKIEAYELEVYRVEYHRLYGTDAVAAKRPSVLGHVAAFIGLGDLPASDIKYTQEELFDQMERFFPELFVSDHRKGMVLEDELKALVYKIDVEKRALLRQQMTNPIFWADRKEGKDLWRVANTFVEDRLLRSAELKYMKEKVLAPAAHAVAGM